MKTKRLLATTVLLTPFAIVPLLSGTTACGSKAATKASESASAVASEPPPKPFVKPSAIIAPPPPSNSADTATKDVVITVKEPHREPNYKVKAQPGGSITVYLPDWRETVWTVDAPDKVLGKPKEQSIPGFAPDGVVGHEFKWSTASVKSGTTSVVKFGSRASKEKHGNPNYVFTLTIDFT